MSTDGGELLALVISGATLLEVLDHLHARLAPDPLTPFMFLRIIQEDLGISFVETRNLLEYFDKQMKPIADVNLINEHGERILRPNHRQA